MFKKIMPLIVLVCSFSLLVACGNQGSASGTSSNSNVRTVQVVSSAESQPLSWKASGNKILGYEPDVLRAIDKKLKNYKFNIQAVSDEGEETGLATGKYDIAAGGYFISSERKSQFLIPSQYDSLSLMRIYVRKNSNINTIKDLVGKKIVPPSPGGGVYNFLVNWAKENPNYKLNYQTSSASMPYPQRLKEVAAGRYDALILPSNLGEQQVINNLKLPIRTTNPVQINKTYILIHKSSENEALNKAVDKALKELKDDGTLSKLSKKYFGEDVFKYDK